MFFTLVITNFFFNLNFAVSADTPKGLLNNDAHLVHRGKFFSQDAKRTEFDKTGTSNHWGYEDKNGPERWGGLCNSNSTRQSPIDFRSNGLKYTLELDRIQYVNYEASGAVELKNTGHTVKVSGFDKWSARNRPHIHGGGLKGRYQLAQLHFHWASEYGNGSEHTVNGVYYPSELHLVHVREGLTLADALHHPEGLAVVGVFIAIGHGDLALSALEDSLQFVRKKDTATIVFNYTVENNLPRNLENFFRYEGSLTTPGCDEAVLWTVYAEPIEVTSSQFGLLRQLEEIDDVSCDLTSPECLSTIHTAGANKNQSTLKQFLFLLATYCILSFFFNGLRYF